MPYRTDRAARSGPTSYFRNYRSPAATWIGPLHTASTAGPESQAAVAHRPELCLTARDQQSFLYICPYRSRAAATVCLAMSPLPPPPRLLLLMLAAVRLCNLQTVGSSWCAQGGHTAGTMWSVHTGVLHFFSSYRSQARGLPVACITQVCVI